MRKKYQWLNKHIGTTATIISNDLNREGKLPKTARQYTRAIVHQVLIGRTQDDNVKSKVEELYNKNK
jgi:hypothetical protein